MISENLDEHMFELKYRPQSIKECILSREDKKIFTEIVKKGKIPHLILHSVSPGTGKTTVAMALCNDINADMLFVNGSDCKIDFVRNELTRFASTIGIDGRPKVIVIDEFDRAGLADSQRHLRTFMEAYGKNCSIIMTANNIDGIIKPLQSRARVIKFGSPVDEADRQSMMKEMIACSLKICENEGIEVKNKKVIAALVKNNFPDLRKVVNSLDLYSTKGVIDDGILDIVLNQASIDDAINAIKSKDVTTLKSISNKYAHEYSSFIEKLANELYSLVNESSIIRMYEIIGENNQFYGMASSQDIHMMYMLVQLAVEMEWK